MKKVLLGIEFYFGIGFINELIDGTGKDLTTLSKEVETNPSVVVPQMMYYSRLYSVKRSGGVVDFNMNHIYDMIDDNGGIFGNFCTDFLNAFSESMFKDVPVDTTKKKVTKTAK